MQQKDFISLELHKVLDILASFCYCEDAALMAKEIVPTTNYNEVESLLNETAEAHRLLARFGGPSFGGLHDVDHAITRASMGGTLTPLELLRIAGNLTVIHAVLEYRTNFAGVKTCLEGYFDHMPQNKYLEDKIKNIILSEDEISDRASATLSNIRRRIIVAENKVRESLQNLVRSSTHKKHLQDSVVTIRDGRFVVPVKAEYAKEIPGMVHDTSQSGATLFIEPASVVDANNELRILKSKEKDEIEHILFELSSEAGNFSDNLKKGYRNVVLLSLIFAKANMGYSMTASIPTLSKNHSVFLKNARHPLLDKKSAVPVNLSLGNEFDVLIITGPNTGGKTVSIKTLGILSLMAMCGLMIPADDGSVTAVFDNILCDIGDEQSIEQSLSTFSAHMTNIKRILACVSKNSLVLLDELGAGTDPVEGAALAESIIEELKLKGAKVAVTTHYAELKAYALRKKNVENASCEFDVETLRPTYKLIIGTIGRSNAFAISSRLGIQDSIIERAESLISSTNKEFEDVIKKLNDTRIQLEKSKEESERTRIEADRNLKKAQENAQKLEKEKEKEIKKAQDLAKNIIEQTRNQSNILLNQLEEIKKEFSKNKDANMLTKARSALKSGFKELDDIANPVIPKSVGAYKLPRPLKVGDRVLVVDIDKEGDVISYKDGDNFAMVAAGIFKTRVVLSNLKLIENKKTSPASTRSFKRNIGEDIRTQSVECDIRGMDTLEGIDTLEKFIDDAVLSKISLITIIHGKGTGALRSAVHTALRKNKQIRTFRLGVYGEGEDGVTIVELK